MKLNLDNLIDFIEKRRTVTMAEIHMYFDNTSGDHSFSLVHDNIVIWAGMSQEFIDTLEALQKSKTVDMVPTTPFVYAFDGMGLDLPIVKKARNYTKPHWLPVVFNPKKKKVA